MLRLLCAGLLLVVALAVTGCACCHKGRCPPTVAGAPPCCPPAPCCP